MTQLIIENRIVFVFRYTCQMSWVNVTLNIVAYILNKRHTGQSIAVEVSPMLVKYF